MTSTPPGPSPDEDARPVLRFAPSPNGRLHLGHALSALVNRRLADRLGAKLLVRIEDIDTGRTREEYVSGIFEDLDWLGISFDGEARRQSRHLADYAARLDGLRERGLIYPCFCTRGEIASAVAERPGHPRDPDGAPLYPGICRDLGERERLARIADGHPHAWRLDMARAVAAAGPFLWREWDGAGAGEKVAADPMAWGDVVLARRDVSTSYHLAVTLDDALQGVTHVVRGRDLYFATAIHRLLQCLLGLPEPLYHHHRLVVDGEGRKLAKSLGSETLASLRAAGCTAADVRRMIGFEDGVL